MRRIVGFWLIAGALALAAGLMIGLAYRRGIPVAVDETAIYRDQLTEVDRDLARGVIGAEEAGRMRNEVARRLLDADRNGPRRIGAAKAGTADAAAEAPRGRSALWALPLVAIVLAASFGGYLELGAPGYPDLPLSKRLAMSENYRQSRPDQAAAEAEVPASPPAQAPDSEFAALIDKLRAAVAARPDDPRGLELLARNEAALGRFAAAKEAQEKLVAAKGDAATAEDQATLAELMIIAAGGYVSPQAEAVLVKTLSLDPKNGTARYYSGLMFEQIGRPDQAFRLWRVLLEESPADAPWVGPIRAQIRDVAWRAGVTYELPPEKAPKDAGQTAQPDAALPGPSAADVEAAGEMSPADRQQMIRGMVDGLMARLADEGGTAPEWARLIASLGVLGDKDKARAIWGEAQTRFADRPADLALVRDAAEQAGVAQ